MESEKLPETFLEEHFNTPLRNIFGIDTVSGQPMWRIVWSDDQFEHRLGTFQDITPAGLFIREVTEVRYLPKYKQWIQQKYVLEHLVGVPIVNAAELPGSKLSYEPIWTFEDKDGNYLPPHLLVAKMIISTVLSAMGHIIDGRTPLKKFVDEEFSQEAQIELKEKRIREMEEYLWGEFAPFHDDIASGSAVMINRKDIN